MDVLAIAAPTRRPNPPPQPAAPTRRPNPKGWGYTYKARLRGLEIIK